MDREAYSKPPGDLSGYKTYVSLQSQKGLPPSDFRQFQRTNWPSSPQQNQEKKIVLPTSPDHDENKDQDVGDTHYNKVKRREMGLKNWRTLSQDGESYGHPTKWDYGYVRRRHGITGAAKMPSPGKRQKNLRGIEKRVKDQYYRRNKNKVLRERKKHYRREIKNDPDRDRYQRLRRKYPNRFKRRGISPYYAPAERTKAWRRERGDIARRRGVKPKNVRSIKAEDWYTWHKVTEPPEGTPPENVQSLRTPNLTEHPQKGLFTPQRKPTPGIRRVSPDRIDPSSGKVIPEWRDFVNKRQKVPEGVPDNYLRNNQGVKTARMAASVAAWYLARHGIF